MATRTQSRRKDRQGPVVDPMESAKVAGLRYVSDTKPGIRRKRSGKGFTFLDPEGKSIRDSEVLRRIASLAIPPAWTEVWISPKPLGHLQATGRDAKGRKHYRYHPRWRAVRDETKYIVSPVQNFLQLPKETGAGHPGDRSREGGGTE